MSGGWRSNAGKKGYRHLRVTCPACRRDVASVGAPEYQSGARYKRHNRPDGGECPASHTEIKDDRPMTEDQRAFLRGIGRADLTR